MMSAGLGVVLWGVEEVAAPSKSDLIAHKVLTCDAMLHLVR